MARFKYIGEPQTYLKTQGPCTAINISYRGFKQTLEPVPPATSFAIGQDIGHEITDARAIKALTVNSRFELIP